MGGEHAKSSWFRPKELRVFQPFNVAINTLFAEGALLQTSSVKCSFISRKQKNKKQMQPASLPLWKLGNALQLATLQDFRSISQVSHKYLTSIWLGVLYQEFREAFEVWFLKLKLALGSVYGLPGQRPAKQPSIAKHSQAVQRFELTKISSSNHDRSWDRS